MNSSGITNILESLKIQPDEISDKNVAEAFRLLLHIIEELNEEVQALKAELQKTRDELNHLKGEQGEPKFPLPKKNKERLKNLLEEQREREKKRRGGQQKPKKN